MNKLLVLFAVVAAAAAMPVDSDLNLLKRLLDALQENKRGSNFVTYDSSTSKLMVSYVARIGATGVAKHHAYVTDSAGKEVGNFQSSQYAVNGKGVMNTYTLSGLVSGATYNVKACELNTDNTESYCNNQPFTA